MSVLLRPTVASDVEQLVGGPPPHRVRGLTAELDGRVIGIGGFRFTPDGVVAAFVIMTEEARRYRVTIHRAGLRMMAEARRLGIRRIVALAEDTRPEAAAWLERLGFVPVSIAGETVWVWQDKEVGRHEP